LTATILPDPAPGGPPPNAARALLDALLQRARLAIFWERLWPALTWLVCAIGVFLALAWLGIFLWLPPLARAAVTIVCGLLAVAALYPLIRLRMPGARDGLSRLDADSGLRHRPATAITDDLAVTSKDPYSLALWNAHVERSLAAARSLKTGWPSPRVARWDPYAVRALVLIACVATFFAAGGERWRRVAAAFDWHGVVLPANFRVDAWVIPPTYTGKPPIMLPGIHPGETAALPPSSGIVAVPVNSTLVVRSTGNADIEVNGKDGVTPSKDAVKAPAGTEEHRFTIAATGSASLRGVGEDLNWAFNAIPDQPPTIELTKDPEQQQRGSLMLSYHLEDDYGVSEAQATFARKDDAAGGEAAHPLYGPPDFPLVMPQARTKNGTGQTIKDLTDHPWAGAEVVMTLTAKDDGGNEGKSDPFSFRLPERVFTKPLARALVEQRRNLALDANSRPLVITALDALTMAPEKFQPEAGVYLGLRNIFWSLVRAKNDDDMRDVAQSMWSMAVQLEDGDISDAQQQLRNAEEALRQALERGAPDQEVKALMDQLRAAMDRFMQAMREQQKNSQQLSRPLGPNDHVLSQRDLQNMLDKLQQLAQSGNKEAAQQLLQQLQQMMENLQMASPNMDQNGDDDDMMSALDELGDMIRKQQDLRDRTFKQGQDQHQQGGQSRRNGQQNPQSGDGNNQLQQNQQALRDRLNKLLDQLKSHGLGQNGEKGQEGQQGQGQGQSQSQGNDQLDQLGHAGSEMDEAQGELGDNNTDSAVESQGRALDAMRKGAQSLAQSMQQQMGQGQSPGRMGRLGQPRADQDTDPLGRPLRGRDYGDDNTVRVPGEIDMQRARRIIEELRNRFGDFSRSQEELDYIERLLKGY
jgi:uncharacterized protein (TIGR02302 family)